MRMFKQHHGVLLALATVAIMGLFLTACGTGANPAAPRSISAQQGSDSGSSATLAHGGTVGLSSDSGECDPEAETCDDSSSGDSSGSNNECDPEAEVCDDESSN